MKNLSRVLLPLLFVSAMLAIPSTSQAGSYKVRQCDSVAGPGKVTSHDEMVFSTNRTGAWLFADYCGSESDWGLAFSSKKDFTYNQGNIARYKISTQGTDLGFTSVSGEPALPLYTPCCGWQINYFVHDNGSNDIVIPGILNYHPFTYTIPGGQTRTDFEYNLKCTSTTCNGLGWTGAFVQTKNIEVTVKDPSQPNAYPGGTLLGGGIKSGTKTFSSLGTDGYSSGVRFVFLTVNGTLFSSQAPDYAPGISCDASTPTYNAIQPCGGTYFKEWTLNTAQPPFVNGANNVQACAMDYSGNAACVNPGTVYVQN